MGVGLLYSTHVYGMLATWILAMGIIIIHIIIINFYELWSSVKNKNNNKFLKKNLLLGKLQREMLES